MNDVPLDHAQLTWSDEPDSFAVVVDARTRTDKFRNLENARGACDAGWSRMTTPERLSIMTSVAWSAVIRDRIPAGVMHRALIAIPEYRGWIEHDAPGREEWEQQSG